jgi:hypothetical protein
VDIDIMHSPKFDRDDLGPLRRFTRELQVLGKIGNWVSTWEREITEGDFSAGVLVKALEEELLSPSELENMEPSDVEAFVRRHELEQHWLDEWNARYMRLRELDRNIDSVDDVDLLDGIMALKKNQLAGRGQK